MTRAPYQPQPGTIPARTIAHLKTLGPGAELTTAQLCEEIGTQDNGFHSCMGPALRADLVRVGKKAGQRFSYWSLGEGKPAPEPDPEPEEEEATTPAKPSAWAFPPKSVFELAEATTGASCVVEKQEAKPKPAPAPKPANALGWSPAPPAAGPVDPVGAEEIADAVMASAAHPVAAQPDAQQLDAYFKALHLTDEPKDELCVFALWSDGRLQLQRSGQELALLSVDETRALLRYLERVCSVEELA